MSGRTIHVYIHDCPLSVYRALPLLEVVGELNDWAAKSFETPTATVTIFRPAVTDERAPDAAPDVDEVRGAAADPAARPQQDDVRVLHEGKGLQRGQGNE